MGIIFQTVHDIIEEHVCKHQLYTLNKSSRGWCTTSIIILTILIEVVVHKEFDFSSLEEKKVNSTPNGTSNEPSERQPSNSPQRLDLESNKQNAKSVPPTATVRANRFAAALILFIPLTVAFAFRMRETRSVSHIRASCQRYIPGDAQINWWALTIFIIIPFISASGAFLRALVDCVLLRWGKTVHWAWLPCMALFVPLFVVSALVFSLGLLTLECVKWPIVVMMGRRDLSFFEQRGTKKEEEVEMREETRRLVSDVDGTGDVDGEGSDGLPAYEEVCGERSEPDVAGEVV